jgi:hypothetical protein
MSIVCQEDLLSAPIKFLGATVLSFNSSLGWGTQESSLNVDLIEDCDAGDIFIGGSLVGGPVMFVAGADFAFGGVLASWTVQQSQGGKTYNVKVVDPRQLLENSVVIVDSYAGPPKQHTNYFNAYAFYEQAVFTDNDCTVFGNATFGSTIERGMPYKRIVDALTGMGISICSSTGFNYTIDLSQLNTLSMPDYFRASGPGLSLLQIIQDVCDANGADFYVTLVGTNVITVNPVVLAPTGGLDVLVGLYNGKATDLSYGTELTNNKVKTIIFGGQQHYLTYSTDFNYYFGENKQGEPIVPIDNGPCGFVVEVDLTPLNLMLFQPLGANTARLTEFEIRAAMASESSWKTMIFNDGGDSMAALIRAAFPDLVDVIKDAMGILPANLAKDRVMVDAIHNIRRAIIDGEKFEMANEIKKIHQFVNNIGNSFYGKKYLVKLSDSICILDDPDNFKEKIYSAVPTNAGGWVEPADIGGGATLQLGAPEIQMIMTDDGRIGAFATFPKAPNVSGVKPSGDSSLPSPSESSDIIGEDYTPGGEE